MLICSGCNEECNGIWEDFGVGSYEFWGQRGNDTRWEWVSDCCNDRIVDEDGNEVDPPEPDHMEWEPDLEFDDDEY